ncbi:hypothetical protein V5799_009602 [Amblyomma americanum]|uniref:Uncharacterized protein n=1 Tax=Amblyomma americanum TaxID=6943 RepID=A0AAQ4FBH6_AMBAM
MTAEARPVAGGHGAAAGTSKRYETHAPVLLSALHAPDSAQRMMLVDLSALHHHQEPVMGFQPDYYSSSSSASMASADYGDTWEDNSLGSDDRLYRCEPRRNAGALLNPSARAFLISPHSTSSLAIQMVANALHSVQRSCRLPSDKTLDHALGSRLSCQDVFFSLC